jgi:hypothetical protein
MPQMKRSGGAIAPAVLAKKKTPARIDIIEPTLRAFGGSRSDKFNGWLINAMARTGWFPPGQTDHQRPVGLSALFCGEPVGRFSLCGLIPDSAIHRLSADPHRIRV